VNTTQRDLAHALRDSGVHVLFGLVGGGNFELAGTFGDIGGRYVGLRHELNAAAACDAYSRTTRSIGAVTFTQGPGLTHAVTAIVEAVKSGTPMLILAADTADPLANQSVNQPALAAAAGAGFERWDQPQADVAQLLGGARARAVRERRPVLVSLRAEAPAAIAAAAPHANAPAGPAGAPAGPPGEQDVAAAASLLQRARRPAILAGRGAYLAGAAGALSELGEHLGAALSTTVMAGGLFAGHRLSAGVCGGFGEDGAAALLTETDVLLAVGASLNPWTTRHGELFTSAAIIHVDDRAEAISAHIPAQLPVVADARAFAAALRDRLAARSEPNRQRAAELAGRLTNLGQARFTPTAPDGRMDPRALAAALDQILPLQRCVTVDGGHFSGWPVMHLRAADPASLLYPHGFQSIGLGLGSAVGLALARPDRLLVAMVGDGGLMMSLGELDTLLSEQLPVLVVVFNDHAYGAELHHFAGRADTALAQLPERDFAGIFQAMGGPACTIRTLDDLGQLQPWLRGRSGPFLIDCKISQAVTAPWLRYAFPAARQPAGRPS
jgi:thiamine pyrophosphate-dependent acetolactate synthase large subunit-like protein